MNQYVIYRVKDTEIGKKLKHMPYNELGELVQEVKAENYEQIYFGLLEDNKKPYQLRKDLEKQIEPGKKLEVGDVLVTNKEGLVTCSYVDSEELIRLSGFICFVDSDAAVKSDTTDYEILQYKGKWRTVDYIIFDGKQYFLMENQMYGAYTMPMLLNQYGQVIMKECNGSFDSESLESSGVKIPHFDTFFQLFQIVIIPYLEGVIMKCFESFYFNLNYSFAFPITFFFYFLHDLPPYLRTTKNPSKLEFFINLV